MIQTNEKFSKRYSTLYGNEYLMESIETRLERFTFYDASVEHSHCSLDSFYIRVQKEEDDDNWRTIRISNHYSRSAGNYDVWFKLSEYCCIRDLKDDIESYLIEEGLIE